MGGNRLRQLNRDGTGKLSPVIIVQTGLVSAVEITEVFPNPFNASATVGFTLTRSSRITLDLVDMQGNEVTQVFGDTSVDAGTHSLTIDAENLPSGTYLLMLRTEQSQHEYPVTLAE